MSKRKKNESSKTSFQAKKINSFNNDDYTTHIFWIILWKSRCQLKGKQGQGNKEVKLDFELVCHFHNQQVSRFLNVLLG